MCGQRAGAETDGPDHRPALDTSAIGEGRSVGVHRRHAGVELPLDTQEFGSLDDRRANPITQGGGNLRATVDNNHVDILVVAEHRAQTRWHLGGGLDAGEATANDHHGVAGNARGLLL
ncbi:hypothetical protein D9M68_999320 [compost metagenome]